MTNETRLREALEPCPNPWCEASEPMVTNAPDFRMPPWACHCDNCGIEAPARENEAEAIRAWNTRAALSLPDQPTVDASPVDQVGEDRVEAVARAIFRSKVERKAPGYAHLTESYFEPFPHDYVDARAAIAALSASTPTDTGAQEPADKSEPQP